MRLCASTFHKKASGLSKHLCANCLHKLAQEHFAQACTRALCTNKLFAQRHLLKLFAHAALCKHFSQTSKWLDQAPLCKLFAQACTRALCMTLHKSTLHKLAVCTKALAQAVCANCFVQALLHKQAVCTSLGRRGKNHFSCNFGTFQNQCVTHCNQSILTKTLRGEGMLFQWCQAISLSSKAENIFSVLPSNSLM